MSTEPTTTPAGSKSQVVERRAGRVASLTVLLVSLIVGTGMVITACLVWAISDRFGFGGTLLTLLGVALIGLTLWGRVHIKAGSVEVNLEQNRNAVKNLFLMLFAGVGLLSSLSTLDLEEVRPSVGKPANVSPRPIKSAPSSAPSHFPLAGDGEGAEWSWQREASRSLWSPRERDGLLVVPGFQSGSSDIPARALFLLGELVRPLDRHESLKLVIHGYADSAGTPEANESLSQGRAEAVRKYFIEQGIDPARIEARGHGIGRPLRSNADREGRAVNRRVEIELRGVWQMLIEEGI